MKKFKEYLTEAKKAPLAPGDKVAIHSKPFVGHDKKTYHLHSFYTGGRGWSNFHHLATDGPTKLTGTYKGVENVRGKNLHHVALDDASQNVKATEFSKRPYVSKKTGKPGPHLSPLETHDELKHHYSVNSGGSVLTSKVEKE